MKQPSILILFFLFPIDFFAQNSLEQELERLLRLYDRQLQTGQTAEALAIMVRADSLASASQVHNTLEYATIQQNRGQALLILRRPDEALPFFQKSLTIKEELLGEGHLETARIRSNMGKAYGLMGQFQEGEELLFEAKAIHEKNGATEGVAYANLMNHFSFFYFNQGNLKEAEKYSLKSLELRETANLPVDAPYAETLQSLAMIANRLGDFLTAETYFARAKTAFEQALGSEHPAYAACLLDYAINCQLKNEFDRAEQFYLQSLDITARTVGTDGLEYAQNAEGLGHLYLRMGNPEKAKPLYLQCLAIKEKAFGKTHPDYAIAVMNLAGYHYFTGELPEAAAHSEEALQILIPTMGKDHPFTMSIMLNLSMIYEALGNYEAAEPMMIEVSGLLEKNFGKEHYQYAVSLMNLGNLQTGLGNYEEAESNLLSALNTLMANVGRETHEYASCLEALIFLHSEQQADTKTLEYVLQAGDIQKKIILRGAQHLSNQELAAYTSKFSTYIHQHFSLLQRMRLTSGPLAEKAYDDALFYKGYLLANSSRVKQLTISDPTFAEQQQQLAELQAQLSAEYAKPPAARVGVAGLEEQANALEKNLVASVASYEEAFRQLSWTDIQAALQPNEAALEFLRFEQQYGEQAGEAVYVALLIQPGALAPSFFPLFSEKKLLELLEPRQGQRIESINQLYAWNEETSASSLYQLVWQPLEAMLAGTATLYFSPDGLLHQLNLGAMAISKEEVLAEQYHLIRLGSTRQLAFPAAGKGQSSLAALFGGIEYEPGSTKKTNRSNAPSTASRRALRLRGEDWDYLEWTQTEVEIIGLMTEEAAIPTRYFTGHAATEELFKSLGNSGGGPQILHLATHGYFFPAPEADATSGNVFQASEHPMMRSGLLLAHANYAWKNGKPIAPDLDDGILTAYEIAQLDLSKTELVTLSACETGLGEIKDLEGVYGLQRAFKLAGATYIVMSLWQIPDFQTQEFMTAFYFNYLKEKMSIPEAFNLARLELRKRYPEPFLWAGFVLIE